MNRSLVLLALVGFVGLLSIDARAGEGFQLVESDRVVLVGNTLIEREQKYGYWETMLTRHFPDKHIIFRNLGWSGDTVFGAARAGFGTVADGFRELRDHVLALKPTVIFVGYGLNESFQGKAGLPHFVQGLQVLLRALGESKARIVLLAPLRHEDLGRPLPDPAEHNKNLRLYCDAIRKAAKKRGYPFVDFYDLLGDGGKAKLSQPLTRNGIHLTPYGYWRSACALESGLGLAPTPTWRVELQGDVKLLSATGTRLGQQPALSFQVTDAMLPVPPPPADSPPAAGALSPRRLLYVRGLTPGKYALQIDGTKVRVATAKQWAAGVVLMQGPEFDQVERLRQAIVAKNRLYFNRWRPENETYLFGFRKYEQGQNAGEIPQFDPLVAKQEERIAKLRVPVVHRYVIVREPGAQK